MIIIHLRKLYCITSFPSMSAGPRSARLDKHLQKYIRDRKLHKKVTIRKHPEQVTRERSPIRFSTPKPKDPEFNNQMEWNKGGKNWTRNPQLTLRQSNATFQQSKLRGAPVNESGQSYGICKPKLGRYSLTTTTLGPQLPETDHRSDSTISDGILWTKTTIPDNPDTKCRLVVY